MGGRLARAGAGKTGFAREAVDMSGATPASASLMKAATKRGGQISGELQMGESYLKDKLDGFMMPANASRAEIIEETIHLKANKLGLPSTGIEGERYAKGLMLRFQKTFGLSDADASIIRKTLRNYEGH